MTELEIETVLAGLPVREIGEAVAWCTRLFEREPDLRPLDEVAEWRLNGGALLQLVERPDSAGSGFVRLRVLDLDATVRQLEARGLPPHELGEFPGIVRFAELRDPSGNEIAFVQQLF